MIGTDTGEQYESDILHSLAIAGVPGLPPEENNASTGSSEAPGGILAGKQEQIPMPGNTGHRFIRKPWEPPPTPKPTPPTEEKTSSPSIVPGQTEPYESRPGLDKPLPDMKSPPLVPPIRNTPPHPNRPPGSVIGDDLQDNPKYAMEVPRDPAGNNPFRIIGEGGAGGGYTPKGVTRITPRAANENVKGELQEGTERSPLTPGQQRLTKFGVHEDDARRLSTDDVKYMEAFAKQKVDAKYGKGAYERTVNRIEDHEADAVAVRESTKKAMEKMPKQTPEEYAKSAKESLQEHIDWVNKEFDKTISKLHKDFPDIPKEVTQDPEKMNMWAKVGFGMLGAGAAGYGPLVLDAATKGRTDELIKLGPWGYWQKRNQEDEDRQRSNSETKGDKK